MMRTIAELEICLSDAVKETDKIQQERERSQFKGCGET